MRAHCWACSHYSFLNQSSLRECMLGGVNVSVWVVKELWVWVLNSMLESWCLQHQDFWKFTQKMMINCKHENQIACDKLFFWKTSVFWIFVIFSITAWAWSIASKKVNWYSLQLDKNNTFSVIPFRWRTGQSTINLWKEI